MGACVSSKILTKSASFREEIQKRLQRRTTDNYEEIFVAVLCSSNTAPNKPNGHESSNQSSVTKEDSKAVEEPQEPENGIETINTWELLAGLEDDNEAEAQREEEELSKSSNPIRNGSEAMEEVKQGELRKGLRRKAMAKELVNVKVPKFEFLRTESLRDWLSQGGHVSSPGSYVTPRFGSFEPAAAGGGGGEESEKAVFDPKLVAQLEEAMEEMIMEEEEILRQIV